MRGEGVGLEGGEQVMNYGGVKGFRIDVRFVKGIVNLFIELFVVRWHRNSLPMTQYNLINIIPHLLTFLLFYLNNFLTF